MATLVLQTIGSVVGNAVGGPIGSALGRAVGGLGGGAIDQALLVPRITVPRNTV